MIKQKNFENFTKFLQVPHFEVQNKTLGVIGAGTIGQHVVKIALTLGMNVLVYSRTPKQWAYKNVHFVSLEEMLTKSDFVTIQRSGPRATRN